MSEIAMLDLSYPSLVQALAWALVHFFWQGALIALSVRAGFALLARRDVRARYLVACCGLLAMAVWPVATLIGGIESSGPVVVVGEGATAGGAQQPVPAVTPTFEAAGAGLAASPTITTGRDLSLGSLGYWLDRSLEPALPWIATAWLLGVLLLAAVHGWGAWRLRRLTRRGVMPLTGSARRTARRLWRRLAEGREVRFLVSSLARVPMVVGFWRPVVLVPLAALHGLAPQQLEAVLAHELAHIRRRDGLVNCLQVVVETLLFYHPAVWWLSDEIRTLREHCCDDLAAEASGGGLVLARALTELEQLRSDSMAATPALALGADGAPLLGRIRRLVGMPGSAGTGNGGALAGGVLAIAILIGSAAAVLAVPPAPPAPVAPPVPEAPSALEAPPAPEPPPAPSASPLPEVAPVPRAAPAPETPPAPGAPPAPSASPLPETVPVPRAAPAPEVPPTPGAPASPPSPAPSSRPMAAPPAPALPVAPSPEDEPRPAPTAAAPSSIGAHPAGIVLASATPAAAPTPTPRGRGGESLPEAEDRGDEIHGHWRAYERRDNLLFEMSLLRGGGWTRTFEDGELVGLVPGSSAPFTLRRDGGTFYFGGFFDGSEGEGTYRFVPAPGYAAVVEAAGMGTIETWQQMELTLAEVELALIEGLAPRGYDDVSLDQLMALGIHDVELGFIDQLVAEGYDGLSIDQLIAFAIHDVTPASIAALRAEGLGEPSVDQLLALHIHDVTPASIAALRAEGLGELSVDRLLALHIHDVTPESIAALRAEGLGDLTLDQLMAFHIHGVTPETIVALRAAGLDDLPAQRWIELSIHDVTPEFVEALAELGYRDLGAQQLIEFSIHDVTPEWIAELAGRGESGLSPRQLVEKRIHDDD